jgi:hypothetical protein
MLFTGAGSDTPANAHRGFVVGRYRDWSWSDIWTEVSRCAPGTFTAVAGACACGWRGPTHTPSCRGLRESQWDWVFLHVAQLPPSAPADGETELGAGVDHPVPP